MKMLTTYIGLQSGIHQFAVNWMVSAVLPAPSRKEIFFSLSHRGPSRTNETIQ